jgi:hypothetical protein
LGDWFMGVLPGKSSYREAHRHRAVDNVFRWVETRFARAGVRADIDPNQPIRGHSRLKRPPASLPQGPAEPPHQEIGSDARKTWPRCLTFVAILPRMNARAVQFRPPLCIGIPISHPAFLV